MNTRECLDGIYIIIEETIGEDTRTYMLDVNGNIKKILRHDILIPNTWRVVWLGINTVVWMEAA